MDLIKTGNVVKSERGYTPRIARAALREAGLRVTAPRAAVLVWLSEHPHATVGQIKAGVSPRLGSVSTQTLYDVLAACTSASLLRRIEPAGHPARYECRTGDNHHHLICRTCGRTEDVDCTTGARPCLTPGDAHGYEVDEAEVLFWGLCPRCLASTKSASGRTAVYDTIEAAAPARIQAQCMHHKEET